MKNTEQNEFRQQVLGAIRRQDLLEPGDRVIAAVSGGADSMALLAFLLAEAETLKITVEAAHVDHGLRGEDSRRDAAFVQQYCEEHGVPLHLYCAREAGVQYPEHPSEDWARRLRYGYLDELAAAQPGPVKIAMAHTLNDQAETLLFRLARGAGIAGAGGIRPRRGVYVRPLLGISRRQVEAYCAQQGIAYVTDGTNLLDDYARNRLRHHAVPALESANPSALQAMGRFCTRMQKLDGYFAAKAETLLEAAQCPGGWQLETLQQADWPVCEAAVMTLARQAADPSEITMALLMQLVHRESGAVQLAPGKGLRARRGMLEWFDPDEPAPEISAPQPLQPGDYCLPGGFFLSVKLLDYEKIIKFKDIPQKDLNYCADYAKIQGNVILRTQQPGDTYKPRGRGHTKPLRKYYWELGLAPARRSVLPLAARGSEVLWLWGQGFADGLAPSPDTSQVLIMIPAEGQEETS